MEQEGFPTGLALIVGLAALGGVIFAGILVGAVIIAGG